MSHEPGHIDIADYERQGYNLGDIPLDPPTPIVGGEGGSMAIEKNVVAFIAARQVAVDSLAQGRTYELVEIDNPKIPDTKVWAYQFTTPFHKPPTSRREAQALIDQLNEDFPSDTHDWVLRDVDEATGIYDIGSRKREASDTKDTLDPTNLVLTKEGGDSTKSDDWATVDLPDGSKIGFLADGRTFNIPADKEEGWFENFDPSDVQEETIGGEDWLIWPDGSRTRVTPEEDKFTGGINPEDVTDVTTIELTDGTSVVILNNGQMIRTGKDVVPAKVTYQGSEMSGVPGKFQVKQPDGSLSFVEPVYEQGFLKGTGGYNLFQQRSGTVTDLGLPEVPAQIETLTGAGGAQQQFIRGTQGELLPLNDVLDRVIEQAIINGDIDKAIAFDDFRKRPSRAEALQMALQYARSPADQYLISALHAGEEYVAPPTAGELQRIGPQAQFLQEAYQEFRDTLTGGRLPTSEEFTAAMAPPPPPEPTALELAQLETVNLKNELLGVQIANATQAGQDAHNLAFSKIGNEGRITDEKINFSTNKSNRDDEYNDWKMNGGNGDTEGDPAAGGDPKGGDPKGGDQDQIPDEPEIVVDATPKTTDPAQVKEYKDALNWASQVGVDYGGNSGLLLRDFREALAEEDEQKQIRADQFAYERDVAEQLTDLGIETAQGDVTNQAEFFEALKIAPTGKSEDYYNAWAQVGYAEPTYQNIAAALTPLTDGERTSADIAAFTDPQGTAAAAEALSFEVESAARSEAQNLALAEKQSDPEYIERLEAGTQSAADAMATIREIEEREGLTPRAGGGRVRRGEVTMVGEEGPELAVFPTGTEIIPLGRPTPNQAQNMRRSGRAYADGGIVFDRYGEGLPSGIRRTIAGQSVAPSAGRLFRAAGLTQPSGQAIRNLLPEELDIYRDIGAQAGIPEGTFQRELALGVPSGERRRGSARFLPLSLRS